MGRGEHRAWQTKTISAVWESRWVGWEGCVWVWLEKLRKAVDLRGSQLLGCENYSANVEKTLEGAGEGRVWYQCLHLPLCLSHKPKGTALLLSGTQATIVHLTQCLWAAVFITSTSLALWTAFLAALISNFIFSSLCSHDLSFSLSLPLPSPRFILWGILPKWSADDQLSLISLIISDLISDPECVGRIAAWLSLQLFCVTFKKIGPTTGFLLQVSRFLLTA